VLTIAEPLNKHETGGETLNGKKLTLLGVVATASAATAFYGLYRAGLIKNKHFIRLFNPVKQSIDDKLKNISNSHATPKARNRLRKK
jgi:hypothetical protein